MFWLCGELRGFGISLDAGVGLLSLMGEIHRRTHSGDLGGWRTMSASEFDVNIGVGIDVLFKLIIEDVTYIGTIAKLHVCC